MYKAHILEKEISIAMMEMREEQEKIKILGVNVTREELAIANNYTKEYISNGWLGFGQLPKPTGSVKRLLESCLAA